MNASPQHPFHLAFAVTDLPATRAFFVAVFGWDWKGEGEQGWFENGAGPIGLHGDDTPMIVPYFPVPDIGAAIAAVRQAGGTVMGEVNREDGFGAFATCSDPRGVRFGLHER